MAGIASPHPGDGREAATLSLPFVPESALERASVADPAWIAGIESAAARRRRPLGAVAEHVAEVLARVDELALDPRDRERLRVVALVHDSFKHRVARGRARTGENHHGMIARSFAEKYVDDPAVLDVIELHESAYNAWLKGERGRDWAAAVARATGLLERLGPSFDLYLRFARADCAAGSRNDAPLDWFERVVEWHRGPLPRAPLSEPGAPQRPG